VYGYCLQNQDVCNGTAAVANPNPTLKFLFFDPLIALTSNLRLLISDIKARGRLAGKVKYFEKDNLVTLVYLLDLGPQDYRAKLRQPLTPTKCQNLL
jgi:hypothetical protein